jgi:C4-dicarboxylate transporter DctM subunit
VGHISGGLAHVNILASMIFGGISGSAVADTAGIGNILIPEMHRRGYGRPYAAAVTAVSSTLGIVIPPSIPMVIIGAMLGVSVGRLFLGGVVPGLLIGLTLMSVAFLHGWRGGTASGSFRLREAAASFARAFWALLMPVLIVVGIVAGAFTPTEAGAGAVVYALVVSAAVYRELSFGALGEALCQTALATGRVFFLIATAGLFSWLLTVNGFPETVGRALASLTTSPEIMLLLIVAILLGVTTFMESIAALVLLLPVLFPVAREVGIDPIHFGVVVVVSIGIGLVTPPVGLCLFVASDIADVDMGATTRAAVPFLAAMIALLLLLVFVPRLVTGLPELIMG